mgnify:CR=1 FL=1
MAWWHEIIERSRAHVGRGAMEVDLDDEIRLHIELEAAANWRAGMEPDAARREALRHFGGVE